MTYAIGRITAIPFGNLIGAPMRAAIEAQALAAKMTVDFIQTVGFKCEDSETDHFANGEDADLGDVRNVTFKYTRKDEEGEETNASLTVPILTIVPIPFLRIAEMTIDFVANISEQYCHVRKSAMVAETERRTSVSGRAGWWWGRISVGFNASYSHRHSSSTEASSRYQTEMTMNVNVRAVQDDLPGGLSRVLNILESIITEERTEAPQ